MSENTLVEDPSLAHLKQLGRSISKNDWGLLLADLRAYPTDFDKERPTERGRKGLDAHSIQDIYDACELIHLKKEGVKERQACFAKDLGSYLAHSPEEEKERKFFEALFNVGTSAYWEKDPELLKGIDRICWALYNVNGEVRYWLD